MSPEELQGFREMTFFIFGSLFFLSVLFAAVTPQKKRSNKYKR